MAAAMARRAWPLLALAAPAATGPSPDAIGDVAATATGTVADPGVAATVVQSAQQTLAVAPSNDLAVLGLGSPYTPVGWIENFLDLLHETTGLPWVGTIVLATIGVRVMLLPLVFRTMRNSVILHNIRPEMEHYTSRMNAYTKDGDREAAQAMQLKLQELFTKNKAHPLGSLLFPFAQMPVFISFFLGLRAMASAPVAAMQTEGLAWFTDLTVPDPYYILPVMNSALLLASIELGSEGNVATDQTRSLKMFFRVFGVAMIPLTASFPTVLFSYWLTSSAFSLSQLLILRIPGLKARLGIPELRALPKSTAPRQGFFETFKSTMEAAKKNAQEEAQRRAEAERAAKALSAGPPPTLANKPAKKAS